MPWQEQSVMELRQEFVRLASAEGANSAELCRRYGISRKTGYKWLGRMAAEGVAGLTDRARRPHTSPRRTAPEGEAQVVTLREAHPAWGGRTLHHFLRQHAGPAVPAPSTITDILHRHARLAPTADAPRRWHSFEHEAPNDLWQLDFMGHHGLGDGRRVHPLTLLDDHSRFALGLVAWPHERGDRVQQHLTSCFQRYGLPHAILTDNGPPWGAMGSGGITALEAWLPRLGVAVWPGRVSHPQTQGKIERLHATIAAEVFAYRSLPDLAACQPAFDAFRHTYNQERPHQALGYAVPASRYQPSPRPFPATLPPIAYGPADLVRQVRGQGAIFFGNRSHVGSRGLFGLPVAVRPTTTDGLFAVVFCQRQVGAIDLRAPAEV